MKNALQLLSVLHSSVRDLICSLYGPAINYLEGQFTEDQAALAKTYLTFCATFLKPLIYRANFWRQRNLSTKNPGFQGFSCTSCYLAKLSRLDFVFELEPFPCQLYFRLYA